MIQIKLKVESMRAGKCLTFEKIFKTKEIDFSSELIIIPKVDIENEIDPLLLADILERHESWSEWWVEEGVSYMRLAIPKSICWVTIIKNDTDRIAYLSSRVKELSAELDSLLKENKK